MLATCSGRSRRDENAKTLHGSARRLATGRATIACTAARYAARTALPRARAARAAMVSLAGTAAALATDGAARRRSPGIENAHGRGRALRLDVTGRYAELSERRGVDERHLARRAAPREGSGAGAPARGERAAGGSVRHDRRDRPMQPPDVGRRDGEPGVARELGQRSRRRDDDRTAARHRLENRQTEPLGQR